MRIENTTMFISVFLLFCWFAGILTPNSMLFDALTDVEGIQTSSFMVVIEGLLLLLTVAGAVIGTFAPQLSTLPFKKGIVVGVFFIIAWDLISIWNVIKEVNIILATVIIGPMLIIYLISCLEWLK
jgi:hypothetical protein